MSADPPTLTASPIVREKLARFQQRELPPESALAAYQNGRREAPLFRLSREPEPATTQPPADAPRLTFLFNPTEGDDFNVPVVLAVVEPHLQIKLMQIARETYAVHGASGLEKLAKAVDAQGMVDEHGNQLVSHVGHVAKVLVDVRRSLMASVEPALEATARMAATIGIERVTRSRGKILREASGYLRVPENAVRGALDGNPAFSGPAVLSLARAMVRIASSREDFEGARDRRWLSELESTPSDFLLFAKMFRSIYEGNITDVADKAMRLARSPVHLARNEQLHREALLHSTIADAAFEHPILYAIWDNPEVTTALAPVVNDDAKLLAAIAPLRELVLGQFRVSLDACVATEERFAKQAIDVWRYQPLIEAARLRLAIPHGTVELRAIEEKLAATQQSLLGTLSLMVGLFEMGLAFGGAAPPFVAIVGVLGFIISTIDVLKSMWDSRHDESAWNACFDPNDSFATVPGHTLAIVFTFIGALFLKGQVGVVKAALR